MADKAATETTESTENTNEYNVIEKEIKIFPFVNSVVSQVLSSKLTGVIEKLSLFLVISEFNDKEKVKWPMS